MSFCLFSQLFASGGGGCCDCGDPEAWTSCVHCELHKPTEQNEDEVARLFIAATVPLVNMVVFSPSTYLSSSPSLLLLLHPRPFPLFPSLLFSLYLPSYHSHPTLPSLYHLPPLSSLSPGGSCGGVILRRGGPCTCVLLHSALVLPGDSLLAGYQGFASQGHEGQEC